jgi:hypothetical protein
VMSRNFVSDEVSWFWIMLSQIYGAGPLAPVFGKLLSKRGCSRDDGDIPHPITYYNKQGTLVGVLELFDCVIILQDPPSRNGEMR